MALTPTGETGKTIQLKRTSLEYTDSKVLSEQLNYGEPLYNDLDKTIIVGDNSTTPNDSLRVFKSLDRDKANSQVFYTGAGSSTLDNASNIANLYTESNSNVYVKDKDWGTFLISSTSTTYGYTIDTNNVIVPGTTQASSFASLPCLVTVNVPGMNANYSPTISLYMQRANSTSVANIQAQNKAFSCIGRVDTASNALRVIFYKKPAVPFYISVVGG